MQIPDKVKIGGHILDVVITNNCDNIDYNEIGKTTLAKNIIYINENYPKSRQEEQDESLVERLGFLLHQIIKDNPDIFKEGEVNNNG